MTTNSANQSHIFARFKRLTVLALVAVLALSLLAGCGSSSGGSRSAVFTIGGKSCSVEEAKIILLQFQKESANLYGIDVWSNEEVDQTGLAQYIKNSTISQLARIYALDIAAEEMEIELTDAETERAAAAAQEYVDALGKNEKKYLAISENDAQQLFEHYLLAQLAYTQITQNVSTEVSDSDALVMDIKRISVSSEDSAQEILDRLADGEDFSSLAYKYSQDSEIDLYVARDTYDEELTDVLFALDDGEYTGIIEQDDMYCIFYCDRYFDEERTEENKEHVLTQRREAAVDEACNGYDIAEDSVLRNNVWSKVDIDTSLELTAPSFREVYEEYFL